MPDTVLDLKLRRNSRLITGSEGLGFNKSEQKWKRIFFISSFNKILLTLAHGARKQSWRTPFLPRGAHVWCMTPTTSHPGFSFPGLCFSRSCSPSHRGRHNLRQKCRRTGTSWNLCKSTASWVPAQVYSDLTGWRWPNLVPFLDLTLLTVKWGPTISDVHTPSGPCHS